jgi:hypothetical protein
MLCEQIAAFFDLQRGRGLPFLGSLSATFSTHENTIKSLIIHLESHFKLLDIQQDVFFTISIILDAL